MLFLLTWGERSCKLTGTETFSLRLQLVTSALLGRVSKEEGGKEVGRKREWKEGNKTE